MKLDFLMNDKHACTYACRFACFGAYNPTFDKYIIMKLTIVFFDWCIQGNNP